MIKLNGPLTADRTKSNDSTGCIKSSTRATRVGQQTWTLNSSSILSNLGTIWDNRSENMPIIELLHLGDLQTGAHTTEAFLFITKHREEGARWDRWTFKVIFMNYSHLSHLTNSLGWWKWESPREWTESAELNQDIVIKKTTTMKTIRWREVPANRFLTDDRTVGCDLLLKSPVACHTFAWSCCLYILVFRLKMSLKRRLLSMLLCCVYCVASLFCLNPNRNNCVSVGARWVYCRWPPLHLYIKMHFRWSDCNRRVLEHMKVEV